MRACWVDLLVRPCLVAGRCYVPCSCVTRTSIGFIEDPGFMVVLGLFLNFPSPRSIYNRGIIVVPRW